MVRKTDKPDELALSQYLLHDALAVSAEHHVDVTAV